MERIQEILFLVLGQLALGGTAILSLPSLKEAGLPFYRVNGIVLMTSLLLGIGIGGPASLLRWPPLYGAFILLLFIYNLRLWFRRPTSSALLLRVAALFGAVGITLSFIIDYSHGVSVLRGFWLSSYVIISSLLLGAGVLAMLLGHRYLTQRISIAPLLQLTKIFMALIFIEGLFAIINLGVALPSERIWNAFLLNNFEGLYLWIRFAIGVIGPMILAPMILKTVQLESTMAATGLLYVAMLMVIIGALFSRFFFLVDVNLI